MRLSRAVTRVVAALSVSASLFFASRAFADGYAEPGQIGMEPAVTPIADYMHWFHNDLLLPVITVISLFVAGLLLFIIYRFNEKANPVPSTTTHHTALEIAWTIIPVLILFVIAIPSMKLLTDELVVPKSDFTIKVTGHQWFWSYEYPKDQNGGFSFDSYLVKDEDLKPGMIRLLSVDNGAVVPVGKTVHILMTSSDVIHSFTVPSFGVRIDAVPGRLNESWFKAEKEGTYYGQCSKICGQDHAYMPIAVKVVSEVEYAKWLQDAKKNFASAAPAASPTFAAAATPSRLRLAGNN